MNRSENMKQQQAKGAKTNQLKGILTHLKKQTKYDQYHNEILDNLIKSGYYKELYNKYIDVNDVNDNYDDITEKDLQILTLYDCCNPDDLKNYYI